MISDKYILLGKSTYAISIILDILYLKGITDVELYTNIDDANNDSLGYHYIHPHVTIVEKSVIDFKHEPHHIYILASIGRSRSAIFDFFSNCGVSSQHFGSLIHPTAVVPICHKTGHGIHISPLSVIAPFVTLGNFVVINRNVSIGHHTVLDDFCTINPGVNIAGLCHIGAHTTIGIGSSVIDKIKIGKHSIIGAGSVVTKDIPEGVVAYGNPAKVIRSL
jgi:sugar O-acyltransferase (sialic acid O-acetyltransferase NeuD family)